MANSEIKKRTMSDERRTTNNRDFRRILIVRLDRIGDVLLSTPAIEAVRKAYPKSHIAVMVRPYTYQVVEGNPHIDEIIVYDKEGNEKNLAGNARFVASLWSKKFDAAIILHPTTRTHILTFLAGIPLRVGYDKKHGFLLTDRIEHTKQLGRKHEIDYTLDVVRAIGVEPLSRKIAMVVSKEAENRIKKILKDEGVRDRDVVVAINPGASCPSKRWSPVNFAKVASQMARLHQARIIVTAGSSDIKIAEKTVSLIDKDCIDLSGKLDLKELAAILRRADLFISNDSGPVHIACAVGTPVVAIFGRSDAGLSPVRWAPTGMFDKAIHKYVGCRACRAHNCILGFKCLEAITADEVVEAAGQILRASRMERSVK